MLQVMTPKVAPYSIIDSARKLALAEHANQKHSGMPFSIHLFAVVGQVACYTRDPEVIAAAWLHDIVEDCESIDLEVVEKMTSPRVAHLVDLLTDPPGPRELAKQVSLPRVVSDPDSALIKLADRYHNHQATIMNKHVKFATAYLSEFDEFLRAFVSTGNDIDPLFYNIVMQGHELRHIAK